MINEDSKAKPVETGLSKHYPLEEFKTEYSPELWGGLSLEDAYEIALDEYWHRLEDEIRDQAEAFRECEEAEEEDEFNRHPELRPRKFIPRDHDEGDDEAEVRHEC